MSWHKTDQEEILAEGRPRPRRGRLRLIVALAVVGAAAWYFLGPSPPPSEVTPETQGPPAKQAERGVAPIRRNAPQAGAPAPDEAGAQRSGERARALIAELKSDPAAGISRAYAQAEASRDDGRLADAYLLYFYAARQGHAASALALGTMADPGLHSPEDSFLDEPDMGQAYKWYAVAAEQGDERARERMAALEQRAETLAAQGDQRAQRLLLQWR